MSTGKRKHPSRASLAALGARLSTATILFHAAVADRMGIGPTDAKCRYVLKQHGAMSAGELAERTGLTTGAITGIVDRLEKARLVRRTADPADRRRVGIEPIADSRREQQIAALYQPMGEAIVKLMASYSDRDLRVIEEFLESASEILERETRSLRH